MLLDERGVALVGAVGIVLVISLMVIVYLRWGGYEGQLVGVRIRAAQALFNADTGIEWGIWKIKNSDTLEDWGTKTAHCYDEGLSALVACGTYEVSFVYTTGILTSTGTYNGISRTVESKNTLALDVAVFVQGAGAFRSRGSRITGGMTIDGRNHERTAPYDYIPSNDGGNGITGSLAVVTNMTEVDARDNNYIGNNVWFGGTDVDPPGSPCIPDCLDYDFLENLPAGVLRWDNLIDTTILSATLIQYHDDMIAAIFRFNQNLPVLTPDELVFGSEHTTDTLLRAKAIANNAFYSYKDEVGALPLPGNGGNFQLKPGVNYVELQITEPQNEWNTRFFPPGTSGGCDASILIIHNDAGNATMRNMRGLIPGIVIIDRIDRITAGGTILGALVVMDDAESFLGVGGGKLLYCYQTVKDALDEADNFADSWKEVVD